MKLDSIRQFKLSSGDELLCEVIEWDDVENAELIVRHCFEVRKWENSELNARYYAIRPYMAFQVGPHHVLSLNSDQILMSGLPTSEMVEQYKIAIKNNEASSEEDDLDAELDLDDRFKRLKSFLDDMDIDLNDSSDPNIITFPSNRKIH
tara:strand:- start:7102 stop:7548 length:447 start_codon:yes stop_codon:yes gene_type:complete